jgi:serine/threonine protein kinase/formylglycine-generating enzyme required for sulfatase activity
MTDPEWQRVRTVFERAVELPEHEREAFLDRECGEHASLRRAVEQLLAQDRDADDGFLEPPDLEPQARPGLQLGEFELREELGRGSMGIVYRAFQPSLQREVAVKVLVEGVTTTRTQLERFHREARAAARLTHGGIVPVLAEGRKGSTHWFAMELVRGHDLERELCAHRDRRPGSRVAILPPPDDPEHIGAVVRIVAEVAEALAHAHTHGVVHRDVKPSNILVTDEGTARLVDFGIARDATFGTLTQDGQVMGSLPYMSPEQARLVERPVDHRTDVYSAGVVLYEVLSSRRPFGGTTSIELLAHIRRGEPQPLRRHNRRIPRELAIVCHKAMHRTPSGRYADAAEFAADLRRFLRHEAVHASPPGLQERLGRLAQRYRVAWIGALLLLVGTAVGIGWARHATERARLQQFEQDLHDHVTLVLGDTGDAPPAVSIARLQQASIDDVRSLRSLLAKAEDEPDLGPRGRADRVAVATSLRAYEASLDASVATRWQHYTRSQSADAEVELDRMAEAMTLLVRQAALFPASVDTSLLTMLCDVSIDVRAHDGSDVAGEVTAVRLAARSGEPDEEQPLGALPITSARLPRGFFRFRIRDRAGNVHELTRRLRRGAAIGIDLTLSEDPGSRDGMVLVQGGRFDRDPTADTSDLREGWRVAPFWIDEAEVSNGDYRAYLRVHPRAELPGYWSTLPEGRDDLPVSDLSWETMRAYAEWRGKRLPTAGEWLWVARNGNELRPYPWGDAAPSDPMPDTRKASLADYLRYTLPVRSAPELASTQPARLFHLFGNVAEATETPTVERHDGQLLRLPFTRLVCGGCWTARASKAQLHTHYKGGVGRAMKSHKIGFRCARSALP